MAQFVKPLLVVEDSDEDFEIIDRCLRRAGYDGPLTRCQTGDQTLDYLHRRGLFADPEPWARPAMMLLDINLPGIDGRTVLTRVKTDPSLRSIPVIVLTTSRDERDIDLCYRAGANSYVAKPVDIEGFSRAMSRLRAFWFEQSILPE
jgi:CheY-like chemotaxis protein